MAALLRNMPITRKMLLAPLLTLVLMGVLGVVALAGVNAARRAMDTAQSRLQVLRLGCAVLERLQSVHAGLYKSLSWRTNGYDGRRIDSLDAGLKRQMDDLLSLADGAPGLRRLERQDAAFFAEAARRIGEYRAQMLSVLDIASADLSTANTFMQPADSRVQVLHDQLSELVEEGARRADTEYRAVQAAFARLISMLAALLLAAAAIAVAASLLIRRSVDRPVRATLDVMARLADGDLTQQARLDSMDEFGRICASLDKAVGGLRGLVSAISGRSAELGSAARELLAVADHLSDTARQMSEKAGGGAASTEGAATSVTAISGAAEQLAQSVNTVAASIEEMGAAAGEVAKNCQEESRIASAADAAARAMQGLMEQLRASAREIGEVVGVINTVANRTNLLALNASIEAASAGEAGRGFAIVAKEVKDLARQTSEATGDIGRRVRDMQASVDGSLKAIADIAATIATISTIAQSIAGAVEEQSATVNEIARAISGSRQAAADIARNVSSSAQGLMKAAADIAGVNSGASDTAAAAEQLRQRARRLAEFAGELQRNVSRFRT